jgi:hypothetical protein
MSTILVGGLRRPHTFVNVRSKGTPDTRCIWPGWERQESICYFAEINLWKAVVWKLEKVEGWDENGL